MISATAVWEPTVERVTTMALREAGILHLTAMPDAAQLAAGREWLALELAGLQARGLLLRAVERYTQATAPGVAYVAPPADTLTVEHGATIRSLDGIDRPLTMLSLAEYQQLGDKTTQDGPLWYYPEKDSAAETWKVYLYPIPTSDWPTLIYPRSRHLRDVDSDAVTLDIPRDHIKTVILALAAHFASNANRWVRADQLQKKADAELERVTGSQTPAGGFEFVMPDLIERTR